MSRHATKWFYVTRKIPFAQVKREGHSQHTAAELRLVSLSLCPFHSRPRSQVPIRAERCEHICFETQPHTPMWAAFRTGSAGRRWAFRCGHRLTAHNIGRVSRRQAASTPDTRHLQSPRIRLCWSLPLRTAPQSVIESACAYGLGSRSTALQERIRLTPLQSGIGSTSCADTRLTVTIQAQCSVRCLSCNA